MRSLILVPGFLALLAAAPAAALDFTVDVLFDGPLDHDTNPGDGVCASSRAAQCGLRTAIEEANARAGLDRILFDVAGTIATSTEGAMPNITSPLTILGQTAPGYASTATDIGNAPPVVYLDGTLQASGDGLRFVNGAANSFVQALGIVAMPDDGISTFGDADGLNVEDCWIGIRAEGGVAGNDDDGLELGTALNDIGKRQQVVEITGLGNVISSNGGNGIHIMAGSGGGNRIAGNRIGTSPNGASARGNGGYGILASDGDNDIGRLILGQGVGNLLASNASGGIYLFAGSDNRVVANSVGINRNGAPLASPGDGIHALGSGHVIGGPDPLEGNRVANHENGIRIGSGALSGNNVVVRNNQVGAVAGGQGVDEFAIWIDEGSGNQVLENTIRHAGQVGIAVGADNTTLQGNDIGYCPTIFGVDDCGTGIHGISVIGNDNLIGRGVAAPLVAQPGNVIGFSGAHGMLVQGSGNTIGFNFVGVTADGDAIGNGENGIRLGAISLQPVGNVVRSNVIRNNVLAAIAVAGNDTAVGNALEFNTLTDNGGPGIDLGIDGIDGNDFGDADEGPNRRLNHPDIASVVFTEGGGGPGVSVDFSVNTSAAAADYPLLVDFYMGREGLRDAGTYVGTANYSTPGAAAIANLSLPPGTGGGWLVAMAVDGVKNSSELSPSVSFGSPDALFRDGFEDL